MRGAGGTPGGAGSFFLGIAMAGAGLYLLLSSIHVSSGFGLGYGVWNLGGFGVSSGMLLVPLCLGVGLVFWNARNPLGWILSVGSLGALVTGVLVSLRFSMGRMSLLDLLVVLVLGCGGLGLVARSLRGS